jgi:hypothetical protein
LAKPQAIPGRDDLVTYSSSRFGEEERCRTFRESRLLVE